MTDLALTDLAVRLRVTAPLRLGPFAGSPLYGALKRRARHTGCGRRRDAESHRPDDAPHADAATCTGARCERPADCPFARLFEPGGATGHDPATRVVLRLDEPDRCSWTDGDDLALRARIIGPLGHDDEAVGALRAALGDLGQTGLGTPHGPAGAAQAGEVTLARHALPDRAPGPRLLVRLDAPLRLRKLTGEMTKRPERAAWALQPHHLAFAAANRLRAFRPDAPRPRHLAEAARGIAVVARRLDLLDIERRARRRTHPAAGLRGSLVLDGVPPEVGRVLVAAAPLHLGAMTSNGYGQVSIWSAADGPAALGPGSPAP